ncbi:MAG TPA: polysaccharide biosynthesis tyrosine autokinase [Pyrinomonadaceae bacterium]|jgi:capsular exopolysaccharide synthesis family protein
MEKDERLLPMPTAKDVQLSTHEYPAAYSPIYSEEEGFNEQRSLREYFNVIYKRLPLILALAILVTSVVAFYMYRLPSQYEAETQMVIEPPKPKQTAKDAININFGNDANYMNTQLRLLQNPDLMSEVVIRLGLHRDPNLLASQNKSFLTTLKTLFSGEKAKTEKESSLPVLPENSESTTTSPSSEKIVLSPEEAERAVAYAGTFLGGLRVETVERTNLVNISIQSTNPDLAAKVANMTANLFIEKDADLAVSGAKKQYEELNKSIEDLKGTIAAQELNYIQEMQRSNIPLREGKGQDFNAERLSTISSNLLAAEDERRKIQAQYEAALKAADGKGGILSQVPDNKAILAAREKYLERQADLDKRLEDIGKQIQEAETEKAALEVKYTPEYPEVKKIAAKIDSLKLNREKIQKEVSEKIDAEGAKLIKNAENEVVTGLRAQLQGAQGREKQLRDDYDRERSLANFSGIAETRLTTLKREIETNRGLLDTYTQRQKEQQLAIESGRPENIKIVTTAIKPSEPIGPQRNRNILVGFLVSLAAGIGLAFLLDYLDDSIRTSDDVGRHLGLPTLALIPHQATSDKRKLLPGKNGTAAPSTALIALEDTRSAMAEAYRHLRTSLLFSSAGKPPQTILVTSSQPSEGKTTTAINTAITLAQSGADVVIIDCDLRRPRLHNHFDLENTVGLTNYLSGEKNTDLFMKPCPGLPKLKIVTSGPIPPNPAELLSSNEMKNLLQFLKGNFKHVIIDSPPAISFTDAAILSTLVDGVVLVAMAGKSSIHLMRRFKQRLANIGARIYGVVLNGIKSDSVEYGYYGYGYTYNYYTANDDDTTPRLEEVETVSSIHRTKN